MAQAVILMGIQASGKSSFWLERYRNTHVRINLDMLHTRSREAALLDFCIKFNQSFVVDNTNPSLEDRARYIVPARKAGFGVEGFYFQSRVADCLARNATRMGLELVPEGAVRGCAGRMVLPDLSEGFDHLWYVSLLPGAGFMVGEWDPAYGKSLVTAASRGGL